ncbi:autotransporter adhesin BigA [Salmonella enterica subsp. enterica serovar Bareilly str. CFSAN000700]|uniref:autotransporter adhesin BigA n=3 Tax=Salmonella enterica TaxID=28901 RepID=UPI0010A8E4C1|nr:autotransporter adhesin BigA [Salmonella enterica]EGS1138422.1 autotransporter adhesin BigA [Salmonella enterica subsp. enterica serovar Bareilly]EGS1143046.1 autotransporter adhesin BigA [Salmonella enterica subsp. enterica serovar Bareilly]EGZ4057101.1 autotransporter adhesin BigA [Salmonella enterica subsp. enterica serovar Bareilly]QCE43998.1 autotransporter adhesin BigA [Salmonella enterica subsp. enterica serovar Bareilly str. CFSAN001140]QCE48469.1 autotransporter adhesin BigA [Salmo
MNPMQKKKLISIAIALTLQSYYIPAIAAENNDDEKECPSNISSLPKEKRAKLSPTCLATPENDNHWGWVAGGVAALVAGVAIGVENNGGGDSNHSYTPPTTDNGGDVTPPDDGGNVTPPDDSGDDNVIPPDDSGDDDVTPPDDSGDDDVTPPDDSGDDDVTPPDDSGDDDVTPPDDSGDDDVTPPDDSGDDDVTPPDDSGDDDVTPPDDSGDDDVTPPDDSGDDDVTPPDDSGDDDVTPPDDSGDDDVTPPDDSGDDDDTPPDDSVITFSNGVTIDKGKDTLTFDSFKLDNGSVLEGAVWNYSEQDNQWQLTTADGKTLNVTGWDVTDANAAVIEGTQENGLYWKYDSRGYLIIADDKTTVISGDDQAHNSDRGMDISGQDRTGVIISGDRTVNTLTGDSSVTDGATGMVISGDGTTNTISGHSTVDNATGALISGNGTTTNFAGDIAVSGGGTAIIIDGDNATIKNTGTSDISGAGSTGTVINGNNARVNNDGDMTITDGGTGGHITGDNVVIDNAGSTTVSGADSTALYIDGDNALVINEGNQTISGGAVGTRIDGDDAHTTNTGDIAVDGVGSAAVIINGDNGSLTQAGDLLVTDGAMGIITYGTGNEAKNTGNATVRDADSVGFVVAGKQNTFSNKGDINVSLDGTGALVSGDTSQVTLDGDINVTSVQDSESIFRAATGVSVSGDSNTVDITGNVNINADYGQDDLAQSDTPIIGVTVSGDGNDVALNGALNIDDKDLSAVSGQYLDVIGLNVTGDDNNVEIGGGINIIHGEQPDDGYSAEVIGINVSGNSNVTLSGHSAIDTNTIMGGHVILAQVSNGGSLILNDDSVIEVTSSYIPTGYYTDYALLMANGSGASVENKGDITSYGVYYIMRADNGAEISNSGNILSYTTGDGSNIEDRSAIVRANGKGSVVRNKADGDITVISDQTPRSSGGYGAYPVKWYNHTFYAMLAADYGDVVNDKGATIHLQGAGVYGVAASRGTASNAGDIYLDAFVPTLDDENNITSTSYWQPSSLYLTSSGMVAGSTDADGDATAINTGNITVNNAGFGMMALNGGTAINQGVITLTADDGVTGQADELVGMAALNGGVVINDTSGVINIDADYGQAFLSDSSSYIINNGSINLNGSPMDDTDSHMGGTPTDKIWIQSLPGSGDSDTRTSDTGFFTAGTLANYGTETLNGDVDVNGGWLYNEAGASLTVNGTVTINGGANALANYGTLDADAISTWHSLFNEADGSITTDLLTLNGDVTFYNNGDFTGSIAGTSYQQEIVNTGDMTVAEDGKSLVSGSFYFYNEEDATLTNSGSAVEGGENTIINLTRANDSLTQVNSGTITATNGYSAITTVNGSNDPKWIWNTATGVINGINPDAPLINLGRGYNFGNQGTINVQGDNAVAISGGTSSYVINLVNSGTINVGTEQGKEDGTNGTGLIGIKGNGNATTINNTADGVINVYADDSYAFGGKTKAIINNGEINLLCDSGCDIYAPGTTGTQNDHNGTADIVIPDATTAPTEGSIPTPPADPNAPQQLSNYIVGTNADGSSGTLKANNLVIGDNVKVDTGFTSGTADTTVVVDNAFTGSNIQGADNITSTSVVWNAQGSQDADGNVDVTMTKNAYADVATDSSVSDVAQALDAGYTNNELYTSLNVGTTAELNSALKQVSGAQATTVFREARVLSNRFTMLADAAPQIKDGLAFNVVAKGDPRAELGNDTQYDMLALRQTLDLTASQNLTLEYGIARLDGDGSKTAGDNGLTGGYSQFFGLKHSMAFDEGLAWNNSLRYDVHNLDSSRSVAYGDVNKIADSDMRQQYLEFRSEGAKTFTMMSDTLKVTPYAGVKFRHTMEGGYKERSAGDFNLSMNSGNETAVDSIVGLKLDYAGKDGWSATATLEGGPNLSYSKSQRTASLQGAAGQSFGVDDGQKGGGINGLATIGVKYSSNDTALHLDAYQWKEDSISDKGFMLNVKKTFR